MNEVTAARRQLTSLLSNDALGRLERMRLNPTRRLTNRSQGEHLAGKGGTSTEFSDYRDYVVGDDLRFVDWNIFARLNRPYVKLYRYEEEMHVAILLDASSSMQFEDKWRRAQQLAVAFGVMGLLNVERVSVYSCHHVGTRPQLMVPCTGRASMKRLFEFVEGLECGGDFPVDEAVEALLKQHRGRGIVILLSDFLTFGELGRPFNLLYSAGLEILAVQILGPSEIAPDVAGDVRFVDSETGDTLDVSSAGELLGVYQEHRASLERQLQIECRRRSGRFVSITANEPIESVLFDLLRRQGWVR